MRSIASGNRRGGPGKFVLAAIVSLGLVAAACSKKDDDDGTVSEGTESVPAATEPAATEAPGDSAAPATEAPASTETESTDAPTTDAPVAAEEPVYGGTLQVSGDAEVANPWTPALMQCDQYCYVRASTFYDTLVGRNADGEYVGVLVESYEPNADFTEWTFQVRPGITFHDGTPLDAAAVVYNLQEHASSLLTATAVADFGRNADGTFAIEATDEMTFTIKTGKGGDLSQPRPWATLPAFLAGQLGYIASPTWLEAVKAGTADEIAAVGTGPFILESYAPRDKTVVTRNPDYWRTDAAGNQLPYLDKVEFRVIEDGETSGQALQSGDIDIFATSVAVVIDEFRGLADEFPMFESSQFGETGYQMIDLDKAGPLQDKRVRCALRMAIDRQELVDLTGAGILPVANGLFSPGQEGYLEDNGNPPAPDVEGAKALIDEYLAENPGPINIKYGTTVTAINAQTAELLQGYWEEIGVTTEIIQIPQDQYITTALFGAPEYEIFGWRSHGGTLVDSQYLWWHSSLAKPDGELSLNFARLRDPVIDENLDAARAEPDPAKRQEYAANVNKQMAAECYNLPAVWAIWGIPHIPEVHGVAVGTFPDGSEMADLNGFFTVAGLWLEQ